MLVVTYIIGALLLMGILLLLYRTVILVGIFQKAEGHQPDKSNVINAWLMVLFLFTFLGLFAWYGFEVRDQLLPQAASIHGVETDRLFWAGTGSLYADAYIAFLCSIQIPLQKHP